FISVSLGGCDACAGKRRAKQGGAGLMKRHTAWIVLFVLMALCTASMYAAAQTRITVLHAMPAGPPTEIFEQLAREFDEAHPDITVEVTWGGGYGATLEKAQVAWASGLAPNIVHIEQMQSFA